GATRHAGHGGDRGARARGAGAVRLPREGRYRRHRQGPHAGPGARAAGGEERQRARGARRLSTAPSGRIASLDAFRGFAIASMVLVNNPGDWSHLYVPLAHAKWNGWTFTDLVFPFFLFAAGMSMAVSLDRRLGAGEDRGK